MRPVLILGEIRTCMLQNSRELRRTTVADLLNLVEGERVRLAERPVAHAVSPARFTGVDCPLPTASKGRCRGVGTVAARAVVTGGRALQGSTYVRVEAGPAQQRLPWSHYLARPGVVLVIGKFAEHDVAAGFLAETTTKDNIDLGAMTERLVNSVQLAPQLDHSTPLRARRTRFRWAAEVSTTATAPSCDLLVVNDTIRTLRLTVPAAAAEDLLGFCEDLALHDWALTNLLALVERSDLGADDGPALSKLGPAMVTLRHLWMPGAHVAPSLLPLWRGLEHRPGFSRQWLATVDRIRDQLTLHSLAVMRNS